MMSAFIPCMRTLLRQSSCGFYRLNRRFATIVSNSFEEDDNKEESTRRSITDVSSNADFKLHQIRGSSADTFGDLLSPVDVPADFVEGDEVDKVEGTSYSRQQDRDRRRVHYAQLITELLSEKKLSMALEVLETEMKDAKAKPDRQIFADLIKFCGKVGYPQKAFNLFNQMKKRGYGVSGGIYTSLFNACGNCPVEHIGLKYAQRLKKTMDDKAWKPNVTTYNAMIKAFGRHGDMETAFFLADEMMREKIPLQSDTMSFILQACISNKDSGFRTALQVWNKFRHFRISPQVCSYNLLLRCVRDTGLGDLASLNAVFKILMPKEEPLKIAAKGVANVHTDNSDEVYPWDMADPNFVCGSTNSQSTIDQNNTSNQSEDYTSRAPAVNVTSGRPNLLAMRPTLGGLVLIDEIKSPSHRLLLIGGSKGVVESMLADGLEPDIKTFTLLLDCIPQSITAEENLMLEMKQNNVEPDTGFFNALIYRRGRRRDYVEGFTVLDTMKKYDVEIDNITVHSLAYCLTDIQSFQKFLDDIKDAGFSPTAAMLGSVLKNALVQTHFKFIHCVMDAYMKYEVKVHKSSFEQLDEFHRKYLRILKGKDRPSPRREKFFKSDYFKIGMKLFICKHSDWKRRVRLDEASDADYHAQFKKTGKEAENLKPYIQKWRKGSRYENAEWRKRKQPAQKTG